MRAVSLYCCIVVCTIECFLQHDDVMNTQNLFRIFIIYNNNKVLLKLVIITYNTDID